MSPGQVKNLMSGDSNFCPLSIKKSSFVVPESTSLNLLTKTDLDTQEYKPSAAGGLCQ